MRGGGGTSVVERRRSGVEALTGIGRGGAVRCREDRHGFGRGRNGSSSPGTELTAAQMASAVRVRGKFDPGRRNRVRGG